jgi:hypothetical protein
MHDLGAPVFQSPGGPQLEIDWRVIAVWQLPFRAAAASRAAKGVARLPRMF